jgi:hypothetical protein
MYINEYKNYVCGPSDLEDICAIFKANDRFSSGLKKPDNALPFFIGTIKPLLDNADYRLVIGSRSLKDYKLVGYKIISIPREIDFAAIMFSESLPGLKNNSKFELEIFTAQLAAELGKLNYFYPITKDDFSKEKTYSLINPEYNRYEKRIYSIVKPDVLLTNKIEKMLFNNVIKREKTMLVVHSLLKNEHRIELHKDALGLSYETIAKKLL